MKERKKKERKKERANKREKKARKDDSELRKLIKKDALMQKEKNQLHPGEYWETPD